MWIDIASIVFVCVTMNHLGLVGEIGKIIGKDIPILSCPKCATFWFTLAYMIGKMGLSIIPQIPLVLAVSFLASYAALWVELAEGYIDTLYTRTYEKIYDTPDDTTAPDTNAGDSAGTVSQL